MLNGLAAPEYHKPGAPTIESFETEGLVLEDVSIVQALCEAETNSITNLLPPALHPTLPGVICWLAYQCPSSPWGPFQMVQTRIECRSANRPRALLLSAMIDNAEAGNTLSSRWGYRVHEADIHFRCSYAATEIRVQQADEEIFSLELQEPVMLPPEAVQFVSGMHPALTPNGYRLIQCDVNHDLNRSERAGSISAEFSGSAWGAPELEPQHIISAAIGRGTITLSSLRYAFEPGEFGLGGGELVSHSRR